MGLESKIGARGKLASEDLVHEALEFALFARSCR